MRENNARTGNYTANDTTTYATPALTEIGEFNEDTLGGYGTTVEPAGFAKF